MQERSLIRASGLAAFRHTLATLALDGDVFAARRRAVVVPTRASAELLRQTIESTAGRSGQHAVVLPDLVTRDEWLARLQQALSGAPPLLSRLEREVLLGAAARRAAERTSIGRAPFDIRPGLVGAMLDSYDELRRRQRSIRRFARTIFDELRGERGTDRGSEELILQTCFLGFAFLGYERGMAGSGGIDEHVLRSRLLAQQPALPFDHLVVAVADHPSDPRGLWPADFDLIGRLRGVARLDVVLTDETHDAGFRARLEQELPGLEERRAAVPASPPPILVRPPGAEPDVICQVSRDRDEELRDVARIIRRRARAPSSAKATDGKPGGRLRERVGIVFHRPLPYLYLGQQVLTEARLPYQAFDALPLASEPYAALLDLVIAFVRTGGTRESAIALLRSRLLSFDLTAGDVSALEGVLAERQITSEADTYVAEVDAAMAAVSARHRDRLAGARRAAEAAASVRDALQPFRHAQSDALRIRTLAGFLRRYERDADADEPGRDRHARARAAVLGVLDGMAAAFERHDDAPRTLHDLVAFIYHAIEGQIFTPRRGRSGVQLVDAVAAPFGEFDHVHLVGLVETDWPERPRRNIFYASGLLKPLGWPQDVDQLRSQQAAFRDVLRLAARTVRLHAFQLESDGIVALSPMIESARELSTTDDGEPARTVVFADEVLMRDEPATDGLPAHTAEWLALRRQRPPLTDPRYRGRVNPRRPETYRVSKVDRYVTCPFKYFAETVLGLPEEREEMSGLTPLERGTLVHALFEDFYRSWQAEGRGTITPATLPDALERFEAIARTAFARLPPADRALEETRLLGSIVARGIAERVFELEADEGGDVVDRLVEVDLRGTFNFPQLAGIIQKPIEIRGKADRIDVFRDGSLRVVDYKLSKLPDESSVQIGTYAHCAQQWLQTKDGRSHPVRAAMYIAFGDDRRLESRLGEPGESVDMAVAARASEFAGKVELIEAGQFPARPLRQGDCQFCRFAGVCRKEYALDEAPAAESL